METKYSNVIVEKQNKCINFISQIDNLWVLNQIYRVLVNITKDTEHEAFAEKKGGAV